MEKIRQQIERSQSQKLDGIVYNLKKYITKHKDRLRDDVTLVFRDLNHYLTKKPKNAHIVEATTFFCYKDLECFYEQQEIRYDKQEKIDEHLIEALIDKTKMGLAQQYMEMIEENIEKEEYKVKYWRNPAATLIEIEKDEENNGLYYKFSTEIGYEIYF